MRVLDCHVHVETADVQRQAFQDDRERADVSGGAVFSLPPAAYCHMDTDQGAQARLDNLEQFIAG